MARQRTQALALLVADVYELAGALRRTGDALAGRIEQSQARWQLLSVLSEGTWTVPSIARRLGVSRQAVQRVADALAHEGYLRFRDNPGHRRSLLVELTRAGRASLARITVSSEEWRAAVASAFSVDELERTRGTVRRLLERVRAVADDAGDG